MNRKKSILYIIYKATLLQDLEVSKLRACAAYIRSTDRTKDWRKCNYHYLSLFIPSPFAKDF